MSRYEKFQKIMIEIMVWFIGTLVVGAFASILIVFIIGVWSMLTHI